MKPFFCLISVAFALVLAVPAQASIIDFQAVLNGPQEPSPSPATGTADVTLNDATGILSITETFAGLIGGPATAAHIHCCALPGVNAGVVLPFAGFPAATSGTFSATFDLATALTGGVSEATFIAGLEAGLAYLNIHNATFPGGEIRGQLTASVPEPATWAMLLLGFAGIGFMAYRRKSKPALIAA
jgi:CHRD domain/PEP-CTERM motif